MAETFTPKPYQRLALDFLLANHNAHLWLDMGLGKTVVVLTAIQKLIHDCDIGAALVFAPVNVVENTWPDEAEKWAHLKGLRLSVARGTAAQRIKALTTPADVYLINYELVPWLADIIQAWRKAGVRIPWDMVVYDESTKLKNPGAKRFRRWKYLLPHWRSVCMTGTPRPNTYLDLWAQTFLHDRGGRLGETFSGFRDRWFEHNPWTHETRMRGGADKEIKRRIKDIVLCMRSEDYLKLPDIIHSKTLVTLPPKVAKVYAELEREMLAQLDNGEKVQAMGAAGVSLKCRQLCAGFLYSGGGLTGEPTTTHPMHDEKLHAIEDAIEEAGGESVLVLYQFRAELEALRKRWPRAPWIGSGSKGQQKTIADWNAGKVRILLAYPGSIGHGLNLQHGGRHMVWASPTWNFDEYQQTLKRLHRQGQTRPVIVRHIVVKGSVEETMMEALQAKKRGHADLIAALRTLRDRR